MSAAIGIKGQPSRFAVLMKDSDSDDDEDELKTKSRVHQNLKGVTKSNKKGESAALKNAKKRARKKKNQSKGNHHEELHEVGRVKVCMINKVSRMCQSMAKGSRNSQKSCTRISNQLIFRNFY